MRYLLRNSLALCLLLTAFTLACVYKAGGGTI